MIQTARRRMRKGSRRDDRTVKIDRGLVTKASLVADVLGISIAEYLSGIIRPHVERDWDKALNKINGSA